MKKPVVLLFVLVLVIACASTAWAGPVDVKVSPDQIDVGLTFKGTDLTVSGTVPEGADVYVKVISPFGSVLKLNKKGRVGPFWMNVESVNVTEVPKLYQVLSSAPLNGLPVEQGKQYGLTAEFDPVYENARVLKHAEENALLEKYDAAVYVDSLVNLYQKSGLYAVNENAVEVNGSKFEATVPLPPNIPQEECKVMVYAFKDGVLMGEQSVPLEVDSIGMVQWLNREAIYDGPNYGFMAVLIALVCGTGIALIFSYLEGLITGNKAGGFNAGAGH